MDLKEIISNHGNTVRSIIKRITNEQNEDLEQEVYTKVWKNSDKYKEKGTFNAWIRTISANLSKDYLKSSKKNFQTIQQVMKPFCHLCPIQKKLRKCFC